MELVARRCRSRSHGLAVSPIRQTARAGGCIVAICSYGYMFMYKHDQVEELHFCPRDEVHNIYVILYVYHVLYISDTFLPHERKEEGCIR